MCGIVSVSLKNKFIDSLELQASLERLHHRGPEEKNFWISKNKKTALGHARLSIIGLENGKQPLYSEQHGIHAVVNGEFYDYQAIRTHYQRQGYEFNTDSDSEIIIPLYLEYGFDLFKKLNGEFSFILCDERNNTILAARDRFGIKPLFYSYDNGNFVAASEIKALLPLGIKAEWDDYALECIFKGVPSQSLSCFKNIKQIKPGNYLFISEKGLKEEKYWDIKFHNTTSLLDEREYVAQFREKLSAAIKKRLVADVPVGFYLSGGIDSSAILALSAQYTSNSRAFNISFEDPKIDESDFAKSVASHVGVELSSIKVTQKDIANNFSDVIFHRESLVFQANGVAKYLLSKHVNEAGFKVVLTGEGADEILGGYPPVKEDLAYYLYERGEKSLLEELKKKGLIAQGNFDAKQLLEIKNKLGFLPSYWKLSFDIGSAIEKCYSDHFKEVSHHYTPMQDFTQLNCLEEEKLNHPVNLSSYIFCKTFFPELVLSYLGDRVEMAHSIEGRVPFLDVDLVEFNANLPMELKIKGEREKHILYEAVKDLIPKIIYDRDKHAIRAPSVRTNNSSTIPPLEELMGDVFHSSDFKELYFFNQSKVLKLFNDMKKENNSTKMLHECALYFALSAYFLNKHFVMPR